MVFLLDTNVLLALLWENHTHHGKASQWLATIGTDRWATCPLTQCGFVRLACNPKVVGSAASPNQAIELLTEITRRPDHDFWPDTVEIATSPHFPRNRLKGYLQVATPICLP